MYAVIGITCIALGILAFGAFMLIARKPNAPAWSGHTMAHEVAAVSVVSLIGFGTGFLLQTLGRLDKEPVTAVHAIAIGVVVAVFVVAWMRLKVRKTLAEYARQAEEAPPPSRPVSPFQPKKAA